MAPWAGGALHGSSPGPKAKPVCLHGLQPPKQHAAFA